MHIRVLFGPRTVLCWLGVAAAAATFHLPGRGRAEGVATAGYERVAKTPVRPNRAGLDDKKGGATGCFIRVSVPKRVDTTKHPPYVLLGEAHIGMTREFCRSMAIAYQYGETFDFVRLVRKTASPALSPEMRDGIQHIPATARVEFYYRSLSDLLAGRLGTLVHVPVYPTDSCAEESFFGIKLHCFNAVGHKGDNMSLVVKPLLFLKLANQHEVPHAILGTDVRPFDFMVAGRLELVDATDSMRPDGSDSDPEFASGQFGDATVSKCQRDGAGNPPGTAHFEFRDAEDPTEVEGYAADLNLCTNSLYPAAWAAGNLHRRITFVCDGAPIDSLHAKIKRAAIYYHESNHRLGRHNNRVFATEVTEGEALPACRCPDPSDAAVPPDANAPPPHEKDLVSVYGVHLQLLFNLSTFADLTADERCELFNVGEEEHFQPRTHSSYPPGFRDPRICGNPRFGFPNPCTR